MIGVTEKNRQEVLGLLLTAFGLLLGLSLIPPGWIEGRLAEDIGSENLAGPVGEFLAGRLLFLLGWGSSLLPVLVVFWGVNRFLEKPLTFPVRMTFLLLGGCLLYSTATVIRSADPAGAGWLAGIMAGWFVGRIGLLGSLLVIYSVGLVLVIVTTGLSIRPVLTRLSSFAAMISGKLSGIVKRLAADAVASICDRLPERTYPLSLTNVSVNGGGDTAVVEAGSAFTVTMDYRIADAGCPDRVNWIMVGLSTDSPPGCIYGGIPGADGTDGSAEIAMQAPRTPGKYDLGFDVRQQEYYCPGSWWNGPPDASRRFATIEVK